MGKKVVLASLLLAIAAGTALAQEPIPLNSWVEMMSPPSKSRFPAYRDYGERYYVVAPVRLPKSGRYTLFAEWDDGGAMLVIVFGYGPSGRPRSAPSGAYSQVALNVQGGKAWRINFTVDPKSAGDTAWVMFLAYKPNRKLRVMIKSPGDPDKTTEAVVKGRYIGSVYKTPLHLFAE